MAAFLNDPMAAGFIWRIALLIFAWTMYYKLVNDPTSHVWWTHLLVSFKLADKEAEEYDEHIRLSKLLFKCLGTLAIVLTLLHALSFYRRYDPYFLWGPKPVHLNGGLPQNLPPPIEGAGGGGTLQPTATTTPAPAAERRKTPVEGTGGTQPEASPAPQGVAPGEPAPGTQPGGAPPPADTSGAPPPASTPGAPPPPADPGAGGVSMPGSRS